MAKTSRKKHVCPICKRGLKSKKKLDEHIKIHLNNLKELKMLKEGYIPSQTKIGTKFRGKNKVIIT